jgi:hypothetical protein
LVFIRVVATACCSISWAKGDVAALLKGDRAALLLLLPAAGAEDGLVAAAAAAVLLLLLMENCGSDMRKLLPDSSLGRR